MNRSALLLADEPTGALDSANGEQVIDLLLDLNQKGQTLLLVTHDERLATRCATRLVESGTAGSSGRPSWRGACGERGLGGVAGRVRRRRVQTVSIVIVVALSTATRVWARSAGRIELSVR